MNSRFQRQLAGAFSFCLLLACAPPLQPLRGGPSAVRQVSEATESELSPQALRLALGQSFGIRDDFSILALTPGYLERKIRTWLTTGQGEKLRREIEYARQIHPQLLIDIVQAHPELYSGDEAQPGIAHVQAVSDYRGINQDFDTYVTTLGNGSAPPAPSYEPNAILVDHVSGSEGANLFAQPGLRSDGSFVVAWFSPRNTDNSVQILLQRYDSQRQPLGQPLVINDGALPRLGMAADGSFVLCWLKRSPDDNTYTLVAQRFDTQGEPDGARLEVSEPNMNTVNFPSLSVAPSGAFAIAWKPQRDAEHQLDRILVKRFSRTGEQEGDATEISSSAEVNGDYINLTRDASERLLVTWTERDPENQTFTFNAQRLLSNGELWGGSVLLTSMPLTDDIFGTTQVIPVVVGMNGDGDFVMAWSRVVSGGYALFMQRFTGMPVTPVGAPVRVQADTHASLTWASISMAPTGQFTLSWFGGPSAYESNVFLRQYDAEDQPLGPTRQLSTIPFASILASVTVNPVTGQTLTGWSHFGPDGSSLYARRDD